MRKLIVICAGVLFIAGLAVAQYTRIGTVKAWTPPKQVEEINDQLAVLSGALTANVVISNFTHLIVVDGLVRDTSPTSFE